MLVDFEFSELYKFSDWPNKSIPKITAGVYVIWHDEPLVNGKARVIYRQLNFQYVVVSYYQ